MPYQAARRAKIGEFGEITPNQARDIARQWAVDRRQGRDPVEQRREAAKERHAARSLTMAAYVETYVKRREIEDRPLNRQHARILVNDVAGLASTIFSAPAPSSRRPPHSRYSTKRFFGVGPKTAEKMARLGIETGADLRARPREWLVATFGSWGDYLHDAARGQDDRPVRANRIRKSVGAENTFSADLRSPSELLEALDGIVDTVWPRIEASRSCGRTVTLKVKYDDFHQITRARSFVEPVIDRARFAEAGKALMLALCPVERPVRLLGLTLSALERPDEDGAAQLGLGL